MKPKISSFIIMIFSHLSVVMFITYVFLDSYNNISYIMHPIIIFYFIIITILFLILEIVEYLILDRKIKILSDKNDEKKAFKENNRNYFHDIYNFFYNYKVDKNIKKINHGFDGILELDNNPPKWWVHLFIITIVFSIIYFISYLFLDFSNPYKEYNYNYEKQLREIKIFEKNAPQVSIENSYFKKEFINEGKILFKENCSTCHKEDGSGSIGPNLTDNYWINKVENDLYKNIFYMIWNGSNNNPTMRAFGKTGEIKGNDIEKISSYVYFINKSKKKPLNQKNPQGKKILEWI